MPNGVPKFQHYIPQFQLRYLTNNDRKLFVYDRIKNEIRLQSLTSIGAVNKFYTYKDKAGNENIDIENMNTEIESIAAPIVKELNSGKKNFITPQEKADLSVLLALNWQRTPRARIRTEVLMEAGAKMLFRMHAIDKDFFHKHIEKVEADTGTNFGNKEDLREFILNDRYRVRFDNLAHLQSMVKNLLEIAEYIQTMSWRIGLISPNENRSFIMSDINFTIEQVEEAPLPYGNGGLLTPGSQSMCVLTNKLVVILQPTINNVSFFKPDLNFIKSCNTINAIRSQRFVFSSSEQLLKKLVERTKLFRIPVEKVGVKVYSGPEDKEFTFTNDD